MKSMTFHMYCCKVYSNNKNNIKYVKYHNINQCDSFDVFIRLKQAFSIRIRIINSVFCNNFIYYDLKNNCLFIMDESWMLY